MGEIMFRQALKLKEKFKKREVTVGTWITLAHTAIAEILCTCPFDWIVIDMEHSVIESSESQQMIQIISLSGKVPLVRLPDQSPTLIKKIMDSGAAGVLIPNVKTAVEAKTAIAAVKYPPIGNRGVGLARAQGYGLKFQSYEHWVNIGSIVILQIEHIIGVKNLSKILEQPGIDGIIIGPYDLSASIGMPGKLDTPKVNKLINEVIKIASQKGIILGFHVVQPNIEEVELRIKQGFNFIAYSLDTIILGDTFMKHLKIIKEKIKGMSRKRV